MHNRAHPRHYRFEYVRGYLHRQADVYSLPGWSQLVIPYIYRVNQKHINLTNEKNPHSYEQKNWYSSRAPVPFKEYVNTNWP